ncbi:transporter [Octadecabacter sp. 1_MG-2023]|uniref:outer membrane protein transport protein n=1 Tax=unclassified Octadecabacter TaxID=196158 RepID=UPI001C08D374|nr:MULTISPECIES: outer membrane protein transport protein [unclassified Octadecabacter]MBU2993332.1 transporter [Octadecabacter sp. B2R22]MDO6733212.1 transporter [Octadecabacter sp. 1_MG-2023]
MKQFVTAGAALLLTTSIATAGGLDRSGQGIGVIFEDGDYAELSFGSVNPTLDGTGIGGDTGNIAPSYTQLGAAYKTQVNDQVSLALIYDQPFGAAVDYDTGSTYILGTSAASVESDGVTGLIRYEINEKYSVHGGLRYVQASGNYEFNLAGYQSGYDTDGGVGYVVGGAYERDDIALRIALTYSSEIDLELEGDFSAGTTLTTTLPESVNLDFQTGIAADTLLFGSIRYVAWDGFALVDSNNPTGSGSILSYDDDVITYNIGVGRRFTDNFAASFAIGYEASTGDATGELGPTDGYISYQIGGAYTMDSGVELSGGVRYVDVGDATTSGVGGVFADNSALAVGLKIGMSF